MAFTVQRRGGATLLELLFVMLLVLVSAAIFMPMLGQSRELSRRFQCADRLRGLGTAVRTFETVHGGLPPGGLISPIPPGVHCPLFSSGFPSPNLVCFDHIGVINGPTYSWIVLILPFLGEQALYDEFDFKRTIYTLDTRPYETVLTQLLCPAHGPAGPHYNGTGVQQASGMQFAKGNYAAWVSPVHHNHQHVFRSALGGFVPGERVGQSLRQIVDGLAQSVLAADIRTLDRDWDLRGAWAPSYVSATILATDHHPPYANPPLQSRRFTPDPNYPHVVTPNSTYADQLLACVQPAYAASQQMPCEHLAFMVSGPRSRHEGGVNAVFLDERVQFLSDDIDFMVYTSMVSVHDLQTNRWSTLQR